MSELTITVMFLVGFGVPIITGVAALFFLWQTRNKIVLAALLITHFIVGITFPLLGFVTWVLLFLAPYSKDYKPKKSSFDDAFADRD